MKEEFDRLYGKLERIEHKIDDHLARITKAEISIEWIRGHVKMVTTIAVTLVGGMLTFIAQYLLGD